MKVKKAIISAGGYGTRIKDFLDKNKIVCKPLIPIQGKPILLRVVEALYSIGVNEIFVSTTRLEYLKAIKEILRDYDNIRFYRSYSPGKLCFQLDLKESYFMTYGNTIINSEHLIKMMKNFNGENIVVSGYKSGSQKIRRIATCKNGKIIEFARKEPKVLAKEEFYIQPPFIFPDSNEIKFCISNNSYIDDYKKRYFTPNSIFDNVELRKKIAVVPSTLPHEIHYSEDVSITEKFLENNHV